MSDSSAQSPARALRGLLEFARGARTHGEVTTALERIAGHVARETAMGFVVIDLYRREWNDFETVAVSGSPEVRAALIGTTSDWSFWAPKFSPEFARSGCQHLGPDGTPGAELDGGWETGEVLFVVLHGSSGDIVGVLRAGAPTDGLRPGPELLDRLALGAELATTVIESAARARETIVARAALDGLGASAAHAPDRRATAATLDEICRRVSTTLGFDRVALLTAEGTGVLRPVAMVGWERDAAFFDHPWLTLAQLPLLLAPGFALHGCALIERETAGELLDLRVALPAGHRNGDGPLAWRDHWLLAPLAGPDGRPAGVLWAGEPHDRLLPGRERLQALRVFAGQAAAALALTTAAPSLPGQDQLTGLPARATLADRLAHALRRERRSDSGIAVLFLDLDRFGQFNDAHGHALGDRLLQRIAIRIDGALRPSDTVARFGGDEFVIVCEDAGGAAEALEVAERLRGAVAAPVVIGADSFTITVSIGVAIAADGLQSADALLQAADRAMYEAKAAGRDGISLASPGASW